MQVAIFFAVSNFPCDEILSRFIGVKLDGSVSHFFHRTFKAYNSGTRKRRKIQHVGDELTGGSGGDVRWHKTGKTKPVLLDGVHVGCKKIMVLYSSLKKGEKPEKTNWVMHQYHLGTGEDEHDGEFVVSKLFYQQQKPSDNNKSEVLHMPVTLVETLETEAVASAISEVDLEVSEHSLAPRVTTSPQHCGDKEHRGLASSSEVYPIVLGLLCSLVPLSIPIRLLNFDDRR